MGEEVGILNLSNVWILGKDENEGACGMYLGRALFFAAQLCNNVCRAFYLSRSRFNVSSMGSSFSF
ncbi:hypothetical protein ACJ8PF_23920, partial [Serratia sp. CY81166]|uniref:hypothetical protein n=1 Tax=Serratia sp. CY81166 TaxID=3383683 RepID=UPI003F9FCD8C